MKVQTKDKDFYRDINNNALINNNIEALNRRRVEKQNQNKLSQLEDDISGLKKDMQEIYSLLKELTNR